ncbi:homoserine dehydrogenase [Aquibacillus koreensis]|uniref:Homoserine dehydrogenase n=1 Tax=Aquibacillus koreensis TaxID=279446 RepID=A0A9X3WKY0_9BACI|nr:homoserine dehydrogenase [Aquibacillus koreensis]MCT2536058.1 homoserine dehydrogenase [Aquibacillus koreensis]MDC3420513.1 homoserine dehydrogenase [Aquibacillus koreensis]
MSEIKVALLGFGTVGKGVYQVVQTHQKRLEAILHKKVRIVGILVQDETKQRDIQADILLSSNIEDILQISDLDIVMEAIVGVEPGYTYIRKAMERGLHVITANKELLAHKGYELKRKAQQHGVRLEYEAAVAGGIPIIRTLKHVLRVNETIKVEAILNGTSNFILSTMRENQAAFVDVLAVAQQKGYAEADPSNDIDGWDAFYKLMIISELLFGHQPAWDKVEVQGIRNIQYEHLLAAKSLDARMKHVATIEISGGKIHASVEPILIPKSHALYAVEGVNNAINVTGDVVGELSFQGPGAGALPTASAMLEDLISIYELKEVSSIPTAQTFVETNQLQEEEWLLVGSLDPVHQLHRLDQWEIPYGLSTITCTRVLANNELIKSIVKQCDQLEAFKMKHNFVSINQKVLA